MDMILLKGNQIKPYLQQIIELYLYVFREPPYLYEGTVEEYWPYIQAYADSEEGIACLLFDDEKLVGAATGAPLNAMPRVFTSVFENNVDKIFYLGEEVLLKEYRGKHFGLQLYRQFINAIPLSFETLACCKIEENIDTPLTAVLKRFGFVEHRDKTMDFSWHDVNSQEEISHTLVYWTKRL